MKKIIRLTESDLVRLVKRVISEQPTGCRNPEEVFKNVPDSFDDFVKTINSQKIACGSKCPTVKGNDAQSFASKYMEKPEYLWGGIASLYEPNDLYMFDEMNNEIINIILKTYGATWSISPNSKPSIIK